MKRESMVKKKQQMSDVEWANFLGNLDFPDVREENAFSIVGDSSKNSFPKKTQKTSDKKRDS
jgi:hypothetical protein